MIVRIVRVAQQPIVHATATAARIVLAFMVGQRRASSVLHARQIERSAGHLFDQAVDVRVFFFGFVDVIVIVVG